MLMKKEDQFGDQPFSILQINPNTMSQKDQLRAHLWLDKKCYVSHL